MSVSIEEGLPSSLILSIFIGFVVALDVSGLIISQRADLRSGRLTPVRQAALHALSHAGLFLIYMAAVSGGIWLFEVLLGVIQEAFKLFAAALTQIWCEMTH